MLINTRADFATTTIPAAVLFVIVGGFSVVGDGGDAKFKVLPSAPSPVVSYWHSQDATGKWVEYFSDHGEVDPRAFGAKTSNTTMNNGPYLQSAIDFIRRQNGGTLKLPPGPLYCSDQLAGYSGITISGHGAGMHYAGYEPIATDIGSSWLVYPANFTGQALRFQTKSPVILQNFGLIMTGGGAQPANLLYIDNHAPGDAAPNTSIGNFGSRITNVHLFGGAIGIQTINCAAAVIENSFIFGCTSCGLMMRNDGTGSPTKIVDGGDCQVENLVIQNFAQHVAGSTNVQLNMVGGLNFSTCKLLGAQTAIQVIANLVGETGEININNCNIEAWAVSGLRVQQDVTGAFIGGINMMGGHLNGGAVGTPEQPIPKVQNAIIYAPGINGQQFIHRGKLHDTDILYDNATPGGTAISLASCLATSVKHNTFQIAADQTYITVADTCSNVIVEDNDRNTDNGELLFGHIAGTTRVRDSNGIPVAALPSSMNNGSMIRTHGGWYQRVTGGWYAM